MTHAQPRHYGGLCDLDHYCPACEDGGECADLFMHPICGLVACATDDEETA